MAMHVKHYVPYFIRLLLTAIVTHMNELLCNINDISDPGAKGFELSFNESTLAFFVVKKDAEVFAYINKCPHVGINLEWRPDDFLNIDKSLIQCSVHGAEFIIETGRCIAGPCQGKMLDSVPLQIDAQGNIFLANS